MVSFKYQHVSLVRPHVPRHAKLIEANLGDTNLSDADLSHADLRNADLTNADLTGADLSSAVWIDSHICANPAIGSCD